MNWINNLLPITSIVLTLATSAGAYMAYRHGKSTTIREFEERARSAMQAELLTLQTRLERLEKDNTRLHQIISTIQTALKQRGLLVTIDGDLITIHDANGVGGNGTTHVAVN